MAHIEQTRAVVEAGETFDGRIVPAAQAELERPVRIRDDATVLGSVYGDTVETAPGSRIEGSVMASEGIELDGGRVEGEVGTPGRVVAEDTRIDGTVTGKRVRLQDCVVRGNVVGAEVILEDCVVLGLATADRRLTIERSLCYTFRGYGQTVLEDATLVLPQAIVGGDLRLETPVDVAGLGRLETREDADGSLPEMTEDDLYEQDETSYLTLAPRVLNLEAVTDRLDELERGVTAAVDDTGGDESAEMSVEDVLELLDVDGVTAGALD